MTGTPEKQSGDDRLRRAPMERFEGPSHAFDLDAVAARLRSEDHPARHGHRQMTIVQREHITHVVFAFEEGGSLPEHKAPGLVTIHVHAGKLRVGEGGRAHELPAGSLLVLDPDVPHSVEALEESVMLLTVHLERHGR